MNNDGEWTNGRMNSFIMSTLRSGMRRWPPFWKAHKAASEGKSINPKTGRVAEHKKCASCHNNLPTKEVQVDHIMPVVDPATGFVSWDETIYRLYCDTSNLQVLCKACHLLKTKADKALRKEPVKETKRVATKRIRSKR